jgi:hypothetical protein
LQLCKLPQKCASNCVNLRGNNNFKIEIGAEKSAGKNKGSGQLIHLPVQRALAVDGSRFIVYGAGRCQTR